MDYVKGILKAIVPRKKKDLIAVSILVPLMTYAGYRTIFPVVPNVFVYSETTYPKAVTRGSYFHLNFDLAWDRSCQVDAKRFIVGSDGIEYLALEDSKQVAAGERVKYVVRIPVDLAIPYGPAQIRSDFTYRCDLWSRYIRPTQSRGRSRTIMVMPESGSMMTPMTPKVCDCSLPPREGFRVVKSHYRRLGKAFGGNKAQKPS